MINKLSLISSHTYFSMLCIMTNMIFPSKLTPTNTDHDRLPKS